MSEGALPVMPWPMPLSLVQMQLLLLPLPLFLPLWSLPGKPLTGKQAKDLDLLEQ